MMPSLQHLQKTNTSRLLRRHRLPSSLNARANRAPSAAVAEAEAAARIRLPLCRKLAAS